VHRLEWAVAAELRAADRLVGDLRDVLSENVALLVTSDHGQVHVDQGGWVDLNELAPMIAMYAGEARFRYLYAQPGAAADLAAGARDAVGHEAWVLTREELFAEGWIGPPPEGPIGNRVGDVVLAVADPARGDRDGDPRVGIADPRVTRVLPERALEILCGLHDRREIAAGGRSARPR